MSVSQAIVLAGGLGTRLRSVVRDVPKPMAPVNGRPFLEHLFDYWIGQGIEHFILSVGYMRDIIVSHFGEKYRGYPLNYAVEEVPLGTGGALMNCVNLVTPASNVLLLNGDTYFPVPLADLVAYHARKNAELTLSLFHTESLGKYSPVNIDAIGRVQGIGHRDSPQGPSRWVNGGVFLVGSPAIDRVRLRTPAKCSLEEDLILDWIVRGASVYGYACNLPFVDIGTPEDYLKFQYATSQSN